MKHITRANVCIGLVVFLAALAAFTLVGHALIPPEALGSIGMLPLAFGGSTVEEAIASVGEMTGAMKAWQAKQGGRLDSMEQVLTDLAKKAGRPNFGGPLPAAMSVDERKAFDGAIRALMAGDKGKADALFVEAKAMAAGSSPDGGYMVNTQFSDGFTKVMQEISPIYRLARVIDLDAGADGFEEPIDRDAADASWVGEKSSRPETDSPQLGMFYVPLREIYAMPKTTQTLVDVASFDVMAWLQSKVGEAFGVKESDAFHNGDSVARPRGFLTHDIATTADATRAWGTIQYVASGSSGAFAAASTTVSPADKLIDLVATLKPQYRAGAVWLMNRNTASVVRKFKDADGRFIWADSLIAGQSATLLGYPVEIDEDMPDLASNSLSVAFGNFKRAYTVIQKPGIKFLPDPYSAKPHVLLYSYRRVGGAMNNSEAIKLMKFAAS